MRGLPLELLVQLFLVFEGFSLWKLLKLPEDTGLTSSDYEKACQGIFDGDGKLSAKIEQSIPLYNARRSKERWQRLVSWFDNAVLSIVLVLLVLVLSCFWDLDSPGWRLGNTIALCGYILVKVAVYWGAHHSYTRLIREINEKITTNASAGTASKFTPDTASPDGAAQ